MEAALVNHASPGDRVVVVSHGFFGDRFTEMPARSACALTCSRSSGASTPNQERCAPSSAGGDPPAVVCMTHVDTSSGVLADCAAPGGDGSRGGA